MVELKNIIEDIVFDFIDTSDESKNNLINKNQKREIAAYVLNRIKPMYITSNKGFTNLIVKYQNDPQFIADIILHISEAIKVIKKSYSSDSLRENLDKEIPYYVFPKIYGKVISSKNILPISNAKITLFIDQEIAVNLFELWNNPVEILPRDEGIFSFAPLPIPAKPPLTKKSFTILITIHKNDKSYDKVFTYDCSPSILNNIENDFHENVLQLEDIYVPFD